ncbi:MAG: vWA domain-containing protein, partial [Clostridium sp.]
FGSIQNTEVFKTNDVKNLSDADNYDLYVFDNVTPEVMPSKGSLLFIKPTSNKYFTVLEGGEIGEATAVQGELSTYLESTKFTLSKYGKVEMPYWGRGFLSVDESAIGFKGEFEGRQIAALTFDLHNSDLALKKEFPILMYELGEDLISTGMLYKSNFKAGEKIIAKGLNLDGELKVTYPNGDVEPIKSGDEIKEEKSLGLYKLNIEEVKELFSVNFPSEKESNTNSQVSGESESLSKVKGDLRRGIALEPFIILLAIGIVGFEWVMYKRGN